MNNIKDPEIEAKFAIDTIWKFMCNEYIDIEDKQNALYGIYNILNDNEVNVNTISYKVRDYVERFKKIQNKQIILNNYVQLLDSFKIYIRPTNREKELNKAIDNCIKKIEEYNDKKLCTNSSINV